MSDQCMLVGLKVKNRVSNATEVQNVLTKFGCSIKARIGLHDAGEEFCSPDGLMVLQVCGEKTEIENMVAALQDIPGVSAQLMIFE